MGFISLYFPLLTFRSFHLYHKTQNQSKINVMRSFTPHSFPLLTLYSPFIFYRTEYSMDAVPIPRGSITSSTPYFS